MKFLHGVTTETALVGKAHGPTWSTRRNSAAREMMQRDCARVCESGSHWCPCVWGSLLKECCYSFIFGWHTHAHNCPHTHTHTRCACLWCWWKTARLENSTLALHGFLSHFSQKRELILITRRWHGVRKMQNSFELDSCSTRRTPDKLNKQLEPIKFNKTWEVAV